MLLKPCPCGKTPTSFTLNGTHGNKYSIATPSCCDEWMFEFLSRYVDLDSKEWQQLAAEAWNALPRGEKE